MSLRSQGLFLHSLLFETNVKALSPYRFEFSKGGGISVKDGKRIVGHYDGGNIVEIDGLLLNSTFEKGGAYPVELKNWYRVI